MSYTLVQHVSVRSQAMKYDRQRVGSRYIEMFKMTSGEAQLPKFYALEE